MPAWFTICRYVPEAGPRTVATRASLDPAARSRLEVEVWPGPMHGFVEIHRQREAFERVMGWIEALHPRATEHQPKGEKAWISS